MALFRRGNTLGLKTQEDKQEETTPTTLPYATPDQLSELGGSIRTEVSGLISNAMAEIRGAFSTLQPQQTQQSQQQSLPQIDDVSEDAYIQALQQGDTDVIRKRDRANQERAARATTQQVNQARAEITPIVESMSTELASTILGTLPYYALFKKDVDTLLNTIPAPQRNRQVIEHIYHSVCGRPENLAKIRTHDQEQQQRRDTEHAMASGTSVRRGSQREEPVSFEKVFGEAITQPTATLQGSGPIWQGRRRGYDPDSYARDVGFQDKNEYTRFSVAVMGVEDCHNCLTPVVGGKCAGWCPENKKRG